MLWMILKILLGLMAIRIVYYGVWYELRRRRRLRTGTWQLDCLKDQCVNGMVLEAGTYLIEEDGDDGYSCEPWNSQCKSLLAQLSPAQLDEIRQTIHGFSGTFPDGRLLDGVEVFYLPGANEDNQPDQSGRIWKWTGWWTRLSQDRGKIIRPPGSRLRSFAQRVYCKKSYERVFEQQLADMQVEYVETLAQDDIWKARWVHVRGIFGFWKTVVVHANVKFIVGVVRATFGL